jgi:DNA polymerase III alpha subunit
MSIIKPNRFVGLHAHSGFSVNDGLGYPQEHIDYIIKNGMDAWALTEHGHMNSFAHAYLHSQKLKKAGGNFKFIPGCEMYLHPDLNLWEEERKLALEAKAGAPDAKRKVASKKQEIVNPLIAITDHDDETVDVVSESEGLTIENEEESKSNKFFNPINRRHHLVVLPKTSEGLQRLFHLVSRGYSEGFYRYPRIDFKMLKEASAGGHLMISTACLTKDAELITEQGLQDLLTIVERVKSGEDVFVLSFNEKNNKMEFKKALWGDMTRKSAKLLRIKTADGKSVTLTPDHKVFTDHGWLEAQELKKHPGIKIMSL